MKISKIKILHVTFNMAIGGTEQVIRQIVENSDNVQFEHEILCIDGFIGSLGQELQQKGIYIECTKRKPGTDLALARLIRNYIKKRAVNVLHCHQYTPYFYGVLGSVFSNAKVIFTEHGRFYPDRHHFKRRFINPLLVLKTSHITSISRATADAVARYEYMDRDKIKVIYNGIKDLKELKVTKGELLKELDLSNKYRYLGTVARLEPIKNQGMMINAFQKAKEIMPEIKLIIIGDGVKMNDLKLQAVNLGLENDVIFTGFLEDPQRYIKLFDLFLLSSFSEGTSMTLLEAMSLSTPCIATDVGGNPEIVINNRTGLIVPTNNEVEFSKAIIELLQNENKLKKYGLESYLFFKKSFSVEKMITSYQSLYLH